MMLKKKKSKDSGLSSIQVSKEFVSKLREYKEKQHLDTYQHALEILLGW